MKRAYQEPHEFDEDAMPCICAICRGSFDLNDGAVNPRKKNETICGGCADDIEKEIERESEIEDLQIQIGDAKDTIAECEKRLKELEINPLKETNI